MSNSTRISRIKNWFLFINKIFMFLDIFLEKYYEDGWENGMYTTNLYWFKNFGFIGFLFIFLLFLSYLAQINSLESLFLSLGGFASVIFWFICFVTGFFQNYSWSLKVISLVCGIVNCIF